MKGLSSAIGGLMKARSKSTRWRIGHGEDCDGDAGVNHERRDEHATNRQFGEAVHHGLVDQLGRRPKPMVSIRNAAQLRSAVAMRAAAWLS